MGTTNRRCLSLGARLCLTDLCPRTDRSPELYALTGLLPELGLKLGPQASGAKLSIDQAGLTVREVTDLMDPKCEAGLACKADLEAGGTKTGDKTTRGDPDGVSC